jgi:hypothetical protein
MGLFQACGGMAEPGGGGKNPAGGVCPQPVTGVAEPGYGVGGCGVGGMGLAQPG